MPSNMEIKAHCSNIEELKKKAEKLSGSEGKIILQEDIFFKTPQGRLKLRIFQGTPSQLIYYERADKAGPKFSDYHVTVVENPQDLKETLQRALGVRGQVNKTRILYLVGQTRVHADQVQGLGNFAELEVVMKDGQTAEEGQQIALALMDKLGLKQEDLITGAYIDLILKGSEPKVDA